MMERIGSFVLLLVLLAGVRSEPVQDFFRGAAASVRQQLATIGGPDFTTVATSEIRLRELLLVKSDLPGSTASSSNVKLELANPEACKSEYGPNYLAEEPIQYVLGNTLTQEKDEHIAIYSSYATPASANHVEELHGLRDYGMCFEATVRNAFLVLTQEYKGILGKTSSTIFNDPVFDEHMSGLLVRSTMVVEGVTLPVEAAIVVGIADKTAVVYFVMKVGKQIYQQDTGRLGTILASKLSKQ
jgi:hypothetical protein